MTTNGIENIPESLEQAQAAYGAALTGALGMRALGQNSPSWRAEHFAASVRFGLAEPDEMARLHGLTKDLRTIPQLSSLLPQVLDGLMSLTGADHGNIQLLDPTTGMLRLVTQAGFGPEFLDYFAVVGGENGSVCGRAARQCAQIVITDVRADPDFAPHREIAAASRFRGVQSTPLIDYAGHLIGMVSTHYQRPHRPSDRDLRLIELYADFAGEAVSRHLGATRDPGDPVGRAVVSALLDPARVREATVSVQFELWVMGQMAASLARRTERRALAPSAITVPRAQDASRQD
jgi:GAF domain-containing protein